jgi:hypothetical protein
MSIFAAEVERVWPGRHAQFEVLGGGITNHNLKVEVDRERFVLRVAGKDTNLLGIDRTVELAATEAAAALGIGPEVVAFVEPEGWRHAIHRRCNPAAGADARVGHARPDRVGATRLP